MPNEHMVAIVSFEGALKREIKRVRRELQKCEGLSNMSLTINVSGRLHEGELKLSYNIGGFPNEVSGDSIQAVVDEFLRRYGWKKIHEAKALTYEKIPSDDSDEIPF